MPRRPDLERAARAIEEFLEAVGAPVGDDPELKGTGDKVAQAFAEDLLSGYDTDPAEVLADTTPTDATGMVVLTDLPTTCTCPHHLMPAEGVVHLGYFPGGAIAGFGALGRLVQCLSRRLVLQEVLARSVAEALVEHLGARGAGCVVDLQPTCLTARGGRHHGAHAITTAFAGSMQSEPALRAEMLQRLPRGPHR